MFSAVVPNRCRAAAAMLLAVAALSLCPAKADSLANPHHSARGAGPAQDDGWRRTAQGWEHIVGKRGVLHSSTKLAIAGQHVPRFPQFTFHPLLLAALEMLLVAAAFKIFPVRSLAGDILSHPIAA